MSLGKPRALALRPSSAAIPRLRRNESICFLKRPLSASHQDYYQRNLASMLAIPTARELFSLLPYLPLLLILLPLMRALYTVLQNRLNSDLFSVPTPPLPIWRTVTLGHNLLHLLLRESSFKAARQINQWSVDHGPLYKIRSLFADLTVIATSASSIRSITLTQQHRYIKPMVTRNALSSLIGESGILLAESPAHATLRKAVAPSMHHDALVAVGDIFLREGVLLSDRFSASQAANQAELLRDVRIHTFKVILEACFGSVNVPPSIADGLQNAYLEAFLEPPGHVLGRSILQSVFHFLPKGWFGWREDLKAYIRATVTDLCATRRNASPAAHGMDTALLSLMVDDQTNRAIPDRELVDTVLSFLTAGQATTSMSVCWMFYLLAKYPEWQERVLAELRENWSDSDGLDALDRLPLLSRIVRECLRLYPPVFYMARELVEPDELDGYKLPRGTIVRVPILAIQRNETLWGDDANEFNPDRFLKDGEIARTKMFWLPFLHGPRGCIGQRFALLEIKAFVAQVLLRKRAYIKPLEDPPPACFGLLATPRGMKVYFEERESL